MSQYLRYFLMLAILGLAVIYGGAIFQMIKGKATGAKP